MLGKSPRAYGKIANGGKGGFSQQIRVKTVKGIVTNGKERGILARRHSGEKRAFTREEGTSLLGA